MPRRDHTTAWCHQTIAYYRRRGWDQIEAADRLGVSQQMLSAYVTGRTRPPVERLGEWADTLRLSQEERRTWLWQALESHTPAVIWERLRDAETALLDLAAQRDDLASQISQIRAELGEALAHRDRLAAELREAQADTAALAADMAALRAQVAQG